jgi:hypothetical protein
MVHVNMNPMPPKVIGGEACLQAKNPLRPSKDTRPKRCPNTWRKEKSKEAKEFMKVGEGNVQHNKYNGPICPSQRITLTNSHGKWDDHDIAIMVMVIVKQGKFKCIKWMNKGDKLYDVPTYYTRFLKYDRFLH